MELRQLRYLEAVVQRASFSAAAVALNITQPALSKSLRSLEQSLGVRLLDRGSNGVRPTLYGEQLTKYAQLVLSLVSEAEQEIEALRGVKKGHLKCGAVPAALRVMVPRAARAFLDSRPDVRLSIVEGLNDALIAALRRGSLDLVVTVLPLEQFSPEIEFRVLQHEAMVIIGEPHHPLARSAGASLAELAAFEWVVPERHEPDRRQLDRLFTNAGLAAPRVAMETTSVTLLPRVLAGATYLSYLPASSVGASNDCVAIRLDCPTWRRTTVAAYRQKETVRPILRSFAQSLEAAARELNVGADLAEVGAAI